MHALDVPQAIGQVVEPRGDETWAVDGLPCGVYDLDDWTTAIETASAAPGRTR
jgi:hypothetical protein